jgi:hypothetical protein
MGLDALGVGACLDVGVAVAGAVPVGVGVEVAVGVDVGVIEIDLLPCLSANCR